MQIQTHAHRVAYKKTLFSSKTQKSTYLTNNICTKVLNTHKMFPPKYMQKDFKHTQKSIYLTNTWSRIEKILKHKKSTYKGYKKIHAQNSQTKLDITLKNT